MCVFFCFFCCCGLFDCFCCFVFVFLCVAYVCLWGCVLVEFFFGLCGFVLFCLCVRLGEWVSEWVICVSVCVLWMVCWVGVVSGGVCGDGGDARERRRRRFKWGLNMYVVYKWWLMLNNVYKKLCVMWEVFLGWWCLCLWVFFWSFLSFSVTLRSRNNFVRRMCCILIVLCLMWCIWCKSCMLIWWCICVWCFFFWGIYLDSYRFVGRF